MKKTILASVFAVALAGPALAGQCPALMAQVDEAMAASSADDATKASVMALYETGKAKHDSGDHGGSVADLTAAMELLGL